MVDDDDQDKTDDSENHWHGNTAMRLVVTATVLKRNPPSTRDINDFEKYNECDKYPTTNMAK